MYSLIAILIAFAFSYYFARDVYNFLLEPLVQTLGDDHGKRIIYTNLLEAFVTYLRLSFLSALFFSFPFVAMQFYLFLAPALYKKEKFFILSIMICCPLLFLSGAFVVYKLVLPLAFKFFLSFQTLHPVAGLPIELEARISEYLDLVIQLIFAFGIAFQLPVLLVCLVKFGILSVEGLKKKRKYWVVLIFGIAAVITPPDVISQLALAVPMVLLYELSIITSSILVKNNDKRE